MLALSLPIAIGVLIGALLTGRLSSWRTTTLKHGLLAFAALAVQLLIFDPPLDEVPGVMAFGPWLYVVTMIVIGAVLLCNAAPSRAPLRLALSAAAVGVALNCIVVTANGGYMPRVATSEWSEVPAPREAGRLVNVRPIDAGTRLTWLADVLPEPRWMPLANILSIGDVLLAFGLGAWAFGVTVGAGWPPRLRDRPGVHEQCLAESAPT